MDRQLSVVVTTHNTPRDLELVLEGLRRQSHLPGEVIVADDGSGPATKRLVRELAGRYPADLGHVWQRHGGFRKARIVNRAVRETRGSYLAFLDGDTIPHRHWASDHVGRARPGIVLCGRRTHLGPDLTPRVTTRMVAEGDLERPFGPVWTSGDTRNLGLAIRLPVLLSRLMELRGRRLTGCNFSLPREAFFEVNGYDEDFVGFGGEDGDLGERLRNAGYRLVPLLNRGCVYHLHHKHRPMPARIRRLTAAKRAAGRRRCDAGVQRGAGGHRSGA